jgi:molybdopterin converting factor small subunit
MRQHADGTNFVEVEGATIQAVLDALCQLYPGLNDRLFANGKLRQFVNLYLNDEDVRFLDGVSTTVTPNDTLVIQPAVAGG